MARTTQGMHPAIGWDATMELTVADLEAIAMRAGVRPSVALDALLGKPDQFRQ